MRHVRLIIAPTLLVLALGAGPVAAAPPGDDTEAARLLFLLQYVGADYGDAVAEGKVLDPFEYREVSTFSATLVERFEVLSAHGASAEIRADLVRLQELVRTLRPWEEVRALVGELTSRLFDELPVVSLPVAPPDPARGAGLYAASCAACHGPAGGGDGFADPAMDPPATSFRDSRMNLLSPHQVYGAVYFGVEGTAMPSYRDALRVQDLWDIVFHVLTLREDFDPAEGPALAGLSLEDVVRHSSEALRARLAAEGLPVEAADVDRLRLHPPEARPPLADAARVATASVARAAADAGGPLDVALRLQDAFAAVAEAVLPSVVSVTSFVRDDAPVAAAPDTHAPAWRLAGDTGDATYPGFRRWRSGSGFFVTADGYVLTCQHVVARDDGTPAEAIDVELPGGRRVLSRLVGAEPTIDLAVLKLEVMAEARPIEVQPAAIGNSDAVQVGHWIIAVGDPWGPERTYAVGTLAARPDRQCYQDELSGTLLQASLDVHPEAYGGPLVDIHGRVVGLTVPAPAGDGLVPRGAEFGLPINLALNIYEALKVAESRRSPWLGVSVLELAAAHRRYRGTAESPPALPRTGVFIDGVFESSPAWRAGVRAGDSLVAIDGNRLFSVLDFQKWLYLSGIGRTVTLEIFRDGKSTSKQVAIEERPPEATTR
jgi:S1-C subfamily serine protease/mono/diheme cytochrome c family protein